MCLSTLLQDNEEQLENLTSSDNEEQLVNLTSSEAQMAARGAALTAKVSQLKGSLAHARGQDRLMSRKRGVSLEVPRRPQDARHRCLSAQGQSSAPAPAPELSLPISGVSILGGTMLFLVSFLVAEESLRFSPPKFSLPQGF